MSFIRLIATITTGLAAVILAVLPLLVAIDFGGVLWWTQYMASLAIMVAFCLTLPTLLAWSTYFRPRQLLIMVPMLLWTAYAAFQTVSLSPGLVKILSPASHSAYTEWLEPILPAEMLPQTFPISIAVDDSVHAVAMLGMVLVLTWTSMQVFNTRARLIGLLSMVAITGAAIAALGIVSQVIPDLAFFETIRNSPGISFSTFVNRNNAALTMNIGLAASFGLLGWRLSALTGQEIDGDEFEFVDLFSLTSDRDSLIGIGCGLLCLIGLLVCGSRSGIIAVMIGTLLSLGWIRQRKGFKTIPVVLVCGAIAVALLTVPLQLNLESLKRLELFSDTSSTILNDGRFQHWPEGWQAGINHLPGGSGLSTYAHAYLPFQNEVAKKWSLHADNLWLELFVEQGFVGISMAVTILVSLIWCLAKMGNSHDAFDHGLRITGWYCIAAILFTQSLDFGLIIPANFLLVVPLFAAIVMRSLDSDLLVPDEEESLSIWTKFQNHATVHHAQTVLGILVMMSVSMLAYQSITTLRANTQSDSTVRYIQQRIASGSVTIETLRKLRAKLPANGLSDVQTAQHFAIADVERRLARLEDVISLNPTTPDQLREINSATRPNFRRLAGTTHDQSLQPLLPKLLSLTQTKIQDGYYNASVVYQTILCRNPIDREARQGLLITDFVDPDPGRTKALLQQLRTLYLASDHQTRDLAVLASQSGYNTIATQLWRRAIQLEPKRSVRLMQSIDNFKSIELVDALPDIPQVYRDVTKNIVARRDKSKYAILPELVTRMRCNDCSSVEEKANCLSLAASAMQEIGKIPEAISFATAATQASPVNSSIRLQLIDMLRANNERDKALENARIGRMNDPNNTRFDEAIKRMAELDVMADQK